jgi:hypothetical protein
MPEIINEFISKNQKRKIKIYKISETNYIVEYFKVQGPYGDMGYLPPSENNIMSYTSDKLRYELQTESKMMVFNGKTFTNLSEAEKSSQTFLEEEND